MFALVFGFAYHCRYKYHKFLPTQEYHLIILKKIYTAVQNQRITLNNLELIDINI